MSLQKTENPAQGDYERRVLFIGMNGDLVRFLRQGGQSFTDGTGQNTRPCAGVKNFDRGLVALNHAGHELRHFDRCEELAMLFAVVPCLVVSLTGVVGKIEPARE